MLSHLFSGRHLGDDLFLGGHGGPLREEGVHLHFNKIRTHKGLVCEHLTHQVLEVVAVAGTTAQLTFVDLPEHALLVHCNVLVNLVADRGLLEWTKASADHEKDHAQGEHVGHDWLIDAAENDLWRHVVERADLLATGAHAILFAAEERARHPEVNQLQVEVRVEHQILQLQVSVAHSRPVHLSHRRDQLVHVVLHDGQGQFA